MTDKKKPSAKKNYEGKIQTIKNNQYKIQTMKNYEGKPLFNPRLSPQRFLQSKLASTALKASYILKCAHF